LVLLPLGSLYRECHTKHGRCQAEEALSVLKRVRTAERPLFEYEREQVSKDKPFVFQSAGDVSW
jgi:hypothetical protein